MVWILVGISCLVGICCAELAARSIAVRANLGTICGRGHLLALVQDRGIYQVDVDRALHELDYLRDIERRGAADVEQRSALNNLIANSAIQAQASSGKISETDLKHSFNLLRSQFPNEKIWRQLLVASGLSGSSVSEKLRNDLRTRRWVAKRIAPELITTEDECRHLYDSHPEKFFLPERLRVSHLFLAAPPETAPEIVEAKRTEIEAFSVRLAGGEDLATLAAENSEDEATKLRGGDLGYFSTNRMPPDFVAAALKLRPGEISPPIRTRLGFHIIKVIDAQPAHQRTFEEARSEIAIELENEKRAAAVQQLIGDLRSEAAFLRPL